MREPLATRVLNRLTTWFPVALLAGLAGLTYWLDSQVQRGDRTPGAAAKIPDYYLEDFSATRYGKDGSVVQQLAAKRMTHARRWSKVSMIGAASRAPTRQPWPPSCRS